MKFERRERDFGEISHRRKGWLDEKKGDTFTFVGGEKGLKMRKS